MGSDTSRTVMMSVAIIAVASLCISCYTHLVKDVDDRLSEYDELFDADGYHERIKGYADTSRGPGDEQDDGR